MVDDISIIFIVNGTPYEQKASRNHSICFARNDALDKAACHDPPYEMRNSEGKFIDGFQTPNELRMKDGDKVYANHAIGWGG